MQRRNEPRVIPDRATYFFVDLESKGRQHLRLPPPTRAGDFIAVMQKSGALAEAKTFEAMNEEEKAARASAMSRSFEIQGYVIGAFWYHREFDLVAEPPKAGTGIDAWMAYGRAVYEELFEDGYDVIELVTMYATCLQRLTTMFADMQEVTEALGFSGARKGAAASKPFTSAPAISATRGRGSGSRPKSASK